MKRVVSSRSLLNVLKSARTRQTGILYVSLVASVLFGIAVSVINTRLLGPDRFGDLRFIQTVWNLTSVLVTFGLFTTGGNRLAVTKTAAQEKPLMGSMLAIAAGISVFFTFLMFVLSYPLGSLYGHELGSKIRMFSGLMFVFPLQMYLQDVLRGTNNIYRLAWLNVLPQAIYIPAALAVNAVFGFSLDLALLLFLTGIALSVVIIITRLRPALTGLGQGVKEVLNENRDIGLHVYFAVLVTTATTQLSQFTLAYYYNTQLVGMFALAITLTMPLTMIPNAISTTFFKDFANQDRIPAKVVTAAVLISSIALVLFLAAVREIVFFLYTDQFALVVPLAYLCAVGGTVRGLGDLYNRYLLAHNMTRPLRTNAMYMGAISVLGYTVLVVQWSAMGAAITKIVVDMAYFASMRIYYHKRTAHKT